MPEDGLQVLVVSGSAGAAESMAAELERDHSIACVKSISSRAALKAALGSGGWDFVIADGEAPVVEPARLFDMVGMREPVVPVLEVFAEPGGGFNVRVVEGAGLGPGHEVSPSFLHALRQALIRIQNGREEGAVHRSIELLERMFANVHMAIAVLDTEFNFVRVNRAYALSGCHEPGWFVGKNHFALYPNEENQALFQRVVDTDTPFTILAKPFTFLDQPERGTTYWDWTLQPLHDDEDAVCGLLLSVLDVTERERARLAAERERERLYSVLNKLPGFVAVISPADHELGFLNKASQEVFGDASGRLCFEVLARRTASCVVCEAIQVAKDGRPREWDWTSPAGRAYHVWGFPFAEAGRDGQVLEFGIDISRQRDLEQEIHGIAVAAQEQAGQELHDSLGQSLMGASMLSSALAQRLAERNSPESKTAMELAAVVSQAVQRTRALAYAISPVQLDNGGLEVGLRRLAKQTQEYLNVRCEFESSGETAVKNKAIAAQLYEIAREALTTAVEHTSPSRIVIRLARESDMLTLSIEDDGADIAETDEDQARADWRLLKHRASMIGASLVGCPGPRGGTMVTCSVPSYIIVSRQAEGSTDGEVEAETEAEAESKAD